MYVPHVLYVLCVCVSLSVCGLGLSVSGKCADLAVVRRMSTVLQGDLWLGGPSPSITSRRRTVSACVQTNSSSFKEARRTQTCAGALAQLEVEERLEVKLTWLKRVQSIFGLGILLVCVAFFIFHHQTLQKLWPT